MKRNFTTMMLLGFLLLGLVAQSQNSLGIGKSGISGLPDTTHYGDTIRNMRLFVVNRGNNIVAGTIVQLQAAPNFAINPFLIGTLDLFQVPLSPGDSIEVPLDYFVVTPQNSNNGSNIMVIWPTAPGTTPSDSAEQGYYVDEVAARSSSDSQPLQWTLFPNPSQGELRFMLRGATVPSPELVVYNAIGNEVYRGLVREMQPIDLRSLPNGSYCCHLRSKQNLVARQKLMICR